MLGAIIGDVIGSIYEIRNIKTEAFPLFDHFSTFTDDTVLTVAVADAILNRKTHADRDEQTRLNRELYARKIKSYALRFPRAGYGAMFHKWFTSANTEPYNSFGNGSAMRVSAVGFAFDTLDEVLHEAELSASVTHNHPEGIKGAQATASSIFLARTGASKAEIKTYVETTFGYNLSETLDEIRPTYHFDVTCQGSVPQAIIAFLESSHFEDAIRKAISIGGDSDTIACITGGLAEAFYKSIPAEIVAQTDAKLALSLKPIIIEFQRKFNLNTYQL